MQYDADHYQIVMYRPGQLGKATIAFKGILSISIDLASGDDQVTITHAPPGGKLVVGTGNGADTTFIGANGGMDLQPRRSVVIKKST